MISVKKLPFKFEAIVTGENKVWGYEVLFNHPLIPNGILFASANPQLDIYLIQLFCKLNNSLHLLNGTRHTFNISLQALLLYFEELSNLLKVCSCLYLEIIETQAFWQEKNIQIVKKFLEKWPKRVFIDDFLKGGNGLQFVDELKPYLAGIKVDLNDIKKICFTSDFRKDLIIVIEKVENTEDLKLAKKKGGTHFQGWFFKNFNLLIEGKYYDVVKK